MQVISIKKIEKAKEEDTRTPLEKRTAQIVNNDTSIGFKYMSGQINVKDVVKHVNSKNWTSETERNIAHGAEMAEKEGFAIKSRIQPEQGQITRPGPVRKKNWDNPIPKASLGKKLKKGDVVPESYTSPSILKARAEKAERERQAQAQAARRGKSGKTLNEYDVKAVNKERKTIKEREVAGSSKIRPTKRELRGELHTKRQKFDIYNVSKHRTVKD